MKVNQEIPLLEYLFLTISDSKNNVKTRLKQGNILVNGKVITQFNYLLKAGDQVEINQHITSSRTLPILYEDKELIIIEKPAGLLTIATTKEKEETAYHMVSDYVKQKNKNNKVFVVHRLDQDTSGILIFAKYSNVQSQLQKDWNQQVKREYIALVEGKVLKKQGTIHSWLKETASHAVYSTNDHTGKEAITHYEVIHTYRKYTLLKIQIETGRKHQIRVHMKDLGHPILGDTKYGKKGKRLYLHASKIQFIHPKTKKKIVVESSIPNYMNPKN